MVDKSPFISIIVPNYNHEKFLEQRLESVFNQTFQDFEVILLDDKSTDASVTILEQYANHSKVSHCVFNEVNSGNTFLQWQKGIVLAKGEYIWIAESDDYCEVDFLEKVSKALFKNEDVVLSYCQSNRVNEKGEITGNWLTHTNDLDPLLFLNNFSMISNEFIEKFLICKNVIPNASAVILRKNAIDIDKHLDIVPEFKYCGDWMFYFKLIVNKKVSFVSESLNNFRYHNNSVIANAISTENRISIIDIEFGLRKIVIQFVKEQGVLSYRKIKRYNDNIVRTLKYEKSLLLIRSSNKIRGYLLLLSVFDIFYRQYNIRKNLSIKIRNFFK